MKATALGKLVGVLLLNYAPKKKKIFFQEINYFSGINWIITGLVPHLHKALLVH